MEENMSPSAVGGYSPCLAETRTKFFLIEQAHLTSLNRGSHVGLVHIKLSVKNGTAFVEKLWYDMATATTDVSEPAQYAIVLHNATFQKHADATNEKTNNENEEPEITPVVSTKRRAYLINSDSDDKRSCSSTNVIPRVLRKKLRQCRDLYEERGSFVDIGKRKEDERLVEKEDSARLLEQAVSTRRSSRSRTPKWKRPLELVMASKKRNGVGEQLPANSGNDCSDSADDCTASYAPKEDENRRGRLRDQEEYSTDSSSGAEIVSDASSDADSEGPPNPYLPKHDELSDSLKPAREQLKSMLGHRNCDPLDTFKHFFAGLLRSIIVQYISGDSTESSLTPQEVRATRLVTENMIQPRLNVLRSSAWNANFQETLDMCRVYKSSREPSLGVDCEACHRREHHASQIVTLSSSKNVTLKKKRSGGADNAEKESFKLGRRCAERSREYHELRHFEVTARKSCSQRVKKVMCQAAGSENINDVVSACLDDDWLANEYSCFQSQLSCADKFMDGDGEKMSNRY